MRLLFLLSLPLFAAPDVTIPATGITPQQVVMSIANPGGSCTIEVSRSPSLAPAIPDVDPALHSGSNVDTSRPDTITQASGTRLVTLGHRTGDRSLPLVTTLYWRVSGCGSIVTGTFLTSNLGNGTTMSMSLPFDSTKWGNMGMPPIDWSTTNKTYIDPNTGAELKPISLNYQTWRTGGGASGATSGFKTFASISGGSGWTNAANIVNGSTSTASTGNTNPVDLFADWSTENLIAYNPSITLEDIGVVAYGNGSSGTAADRMVTLDLRKHGTSCGTVVVTMPTGAVAHVSAAGSTDPDAAFPSTFPANPFSSWTGSSFSPCLHNEDMQTSGTLTVTGSALVITLPTAANSFSSVLVAGDRIFISGSSPGCTSNLCTIATVTDPGHATVSETPSATGTQSYISYGWLIRATKNNATGTVGVGLKYKLAGSYHPLGVEPGGDKCSKAVQASGDAIPIPGYVCQLTSITAGYYALAFIGNEGTSRIFYDQIPASLAGVGFDPSNGNVFYIGTNNGSGGRGVSKLTYTGDYTTSIDYAYGCGSNGVCPTLNEHMTVTDIMPNSGSPATGDLNQQIVTNFPSYSSALYGNWNASNGNVAYYGSSGHYAIYGNLYSGQGQPNSGGPGWIAKIDISTTPALVIDLWDTLSGGTSCTNCRFMSAHSFVAQDSADNTMLIVGDGLAASNTSTLHGGPFQTTPDGVLLADGVTWDTNTCLDYPTNSGVGCPPRASNPVTVTCPGGTAYTQCVTLRMTLPSGKIPNKFATAAEIAAFPCTGSHPTWACPVTMITGDNATDFGPGASPFNTDSEHFRPLTITIISGESYKVVIGRNAVYDYCSISPWQGATNTFSAQSVSQLFHNDGWIWTMMPGHRPNISNSCGSANLLVNLSTNVVADMGHSFAGHLHLGPGPTPGNLSLLTTAFTAYDLPFASLDQIPPVVNTTADPTWQGNHANIGASNSLQSYVDESQYAAGASNLVFGLDTNPLVGCAFEQFGCGPTRTFSHVTGDVYTVQGLGGLTSNEATYKVQALLGSAGRYILQDLGGGVVDSVPYSVSLALVAGEGHAGSSPGTIYVNIPKFYDAGNYFQPSQSWANNPGAFLGYNAPGGFNRQYRISANDANGQYSRALTSGWGSFAAHWPYTYTSYHPSGGWIINPGTQFVEGHGMVTWLVKAPTWAPDSTVRNAFIASPITAAPGNAYVRIRFGYGEYGTPAQMYCTARPESCITDGSVTPYAFITTDAGSLMPVSTCAAGCTVNVPSIPMRELYYRIERSTDGMMWDTTGDINVRSIGPVAPPPPVSALSVQYRGQISLRGNISTR